ncbi:density-regulated protein homolog [Cimex lectularius]|uniref:SUI1 domain-containing protein n=1 Tax=Cimex lectularius TaxID=79782 RepID=A0A8I6RN85_CIMLE|nr:density-regulated protein homolog [Cimex lectularius]
MGVTYPLEVRYCDNCSLPTEYCEYFPGRIMCNSWLSNGKSLGKQEDDNSRKKGVRRNSQKPEVCLSWAPRGKRKSVTVITGLSNFGVDLKTASSYFGSSLATGASVTGEDEIVVQGDVKEKIRKLIPARWPAITSDLIGDLGYLRR